MEHAQTPPPTQTPEPTHPPTTIPGTTPDPVPPTKKRPKKLMLLLVVVIALGAAAFISLVVWYKVQLAPRTVRTVYHVVEVKSGESTADIAQHLEEKEIIKSSSAFLWMLRINRIGPLQAGVYRLSSAQTSLEVARTLEDGKVSAVDVLILPGQRLSQITQKLVEAGYTTQEVETALSQVRAHNLLRTLSSDEPLEGYLFPDTYKIAPNTSATQLLYLMVDNFEAKITPKIISGLKKQGLSLHEGVILASIVQKEVSDYPNQQKVAQVFLKRLNEGVVLGSDVTFQYAAAETGQEATPDLNSPYNTRKVAGLPPTAIANFNLSALEAVANPTSTSYNYFVAGDDGTVYYSKTEAEHEALTRQHCQSCFQ